MLHKTSRFLIVSAVIHKKVNGQYGGYTPYVREMNLWFKYVDQVRVIAPLADIDMDPLESVYEHPNLKFIRVPALDFRTSKRALKSILHLPLILFRLFQGMVWATHIHLRCPANMGLLGSLVQVFFPFKPKTVKYANNWDWNSYQPLTYRIQQHILRSRFLTHKTKVLVYGDWKEKSKNILPFFTASYTHENRTPVSLRNVSPDMDVVRLLFVGTLTDNKRPLECIQTLENLKAKGVNATLDLIGDGAQRDELKNYVKNQKITDAVRFYGKQSPDEVIEFFKTAHFLVFLSRSEGWPKVVAESMWWGCLPVTTNVSCVKQMVGNLERGILVYPDPETVSEQILDIIEKPEVYKRMCQAAMDWAREYTLERFENEVAKLLQQN